MPQSALPYVIQAETGYGKYLSPDLEPVIDPGAVEGILQLVKAVSCQPDGGIAPSFSSLRPGKMMPADIEAAHPGQAAVYQTDFAMIAPVHGFQQMPDFGNEEYQQMVCVEPGNVGENKITLPAGKSASLKIEISTMPL